MPSQGAQLVVKLISRTAPAGPSRISPLGHESSYDPVECHLVVVAVLGQKYEVINCIGGLLGKELDDDLAALLQYYSGRVALVRVDRHRRRRAVCLGFGGHDWSLLLGSTWHPAFVYRHSQHCKWRSGLRRRGDGDRGLRGRSRGRLLLGSTGHQGSHQRCGRQCQYAAYVYSRHLLLLAKRSGGGADFLRRLGDRPAEASHQLAQLRQFLLGDR